MSKNSELTIPFPYNHLLFINSPRKKGKNRETEINGNRWLVVENNGIGRKHLQILEITKHRG